MRRRQSAVLGYDSPLRVLSASAAAKLLNNANTARVSDVSERFYQHILVTGFATRAETETAIQTCPSLMRWGG